ncbi:STAS domain-containing protein [Kitasatospora sp. NPDC059571]|uniref:STAS domain-containing protein n=1 Tax=Kitasatospora sp. NPDC059571 TaxID=3346871 RepID=UPI0036770720
MTDRVLTVALHRRDDRAWILEVSGELDQHNASQLRAALDELPLTGGGLLVANLAGLAYCDSTGITVLVNAYQRAARTGAVLMLAGLRPELARIFEIAGLHQLFSFQPTVEAAVRAAQG